ncbi:MliC family protein [Lysobacter sp. Root494]|uniref:MliC family protein n=1 Tax=Lysobacter sp. Root494 TaxID=1736549 RepID=UPI0009E667F9|nr:MliC family protein [Lysobacter sp. Root494]
MASYRLSLLVGIPVCVLALTACKPSSQDKTVADASAPPTASGTTASTHRTATAVTRWRCGELAVATHFDDESLESITLETADRELTLKSMANEDGARFADAAGNEFWSRPGRVTLTRVGQPVVECTKDRG